MGCGKDNYNVASHFRASKAHALAVAHVLNLKIAMSIISVARTDK